VPMYAQRIAPLSSGRLLVQVRDGNLQGSVIHQGQIREPT
jgi:hypothetical protein